MLNILSMGYAHPTGVIDNQFLEDLDIGTNAQWIIDKIGIEERKTSLDIKYIQESRNSDPTKALARSATNATELGVKAAEMALKNANLKAKDIGLLLVNCCTPPAVVPPESHRIADKLGITAECYDVFTACPAFALHLDFLNNFRDEELPEYVLCVCTATLTHSVNYNDRSDGAIWGDGASAWIVSAKHPGKIKVIDTVFNADPTRCEAVVVNRFGHFGQDGRAVRDFSVRQTVRLIKRLEADFVIDWSRDSFIGHQANKTMLDQITNNRNIPAENHWHNVTKIGNQAGASAPAVLAMNWDKIKPGQKIVAAACGSTGTTYRFAIPIPNQIRSIYKGQKIYATEYSPHGFPEFNLQNSGLFTIP